MKISFVIPAYNEEAYLPFCLAALTAEIERSAAGLETEIIVVDNASTDGTAAAAKRVRGVAVVSEPVKGVARARQKGLEAARGEIIAYVDADTRVYPGWIPVMLAQFTDPAIVAVSGPYTYDDLPGFWRAAAWPYHYVVGHVTSFFTGQWVFGGNFAARRAAMLEVGGFDTSIAFYGEDQNIVQRLKKAGTYRFVFELKAYSSARRYNAEGVLKMIFVYAVNFISVAIFKHAPDMEVKDIR